EARGGAELPGDGRRHRRAHPDIEDARAPRARSIAASAGGASMKPIDPRVHQALDREIAPEGLPPELALQVARLDAAAAVLGTAVSRWAGGEGSVEARVIAAIRRPAPSRMWRLARWLAAPHSVTLRIRPAWSLALAAVVALVTLLPAGRETPSG